MSATNEFVRACADAARMAETLARFLNEHMEVEPDNVHWGHVGDVNHIKAQLSELIERHRLNG
jgi:hypothetical protein